MITGAIRANEGRIRLKTKGPRGRQQEVQEVIAIIDTGYSGSLTLPASLIAALRLRWHSVDRATLGDGSQCTFDVYQGKVLWDGKVRSILVDEADTDVLVGMKLLKGHELKMQIRSGGKVTIKRLPRK